MSNCVHSCFFSFYGVDKFSVLVALAIRGIFFLISYSSKHLFIIDKYLFGNEVKGVQQEVVNMSDGCIELPQYGTKHSLNVSVTAGIVIWEFARQLLIE